MGKGRKGLRDRLGNVPYEGCIIGGLQHLEIGLGTDHVKSDSRALAQAYAALFEQEVLHRQHADSAIDFIKKDLTVEIGRRVEDRLLLEEMLMHQLGMRALI